jgi:hypothetical protein
MLQKEDLVHQYDQTVSYSRTWLKKLTMILTSVLLLSMFGLGGYWLGARQQQSSPRDLLTKHKPSWSPSATPVQQRSTSPTITTGQTDQILNWKTYKDVEGRFSIKYPSDWQLHFLPSQAGGRPELPMFFKKAPPDQVTYSIYLSICLR